MDLFPTSPAVRRRAAGGGGVPHPSDPFAGRVARPTIGLMTLFSALGADHPVKIATAVFMAIKDGSFSAPAVSQFFTPESLADWGDFSTAQARFASIDSPGIGTTANPAVGAPDVVYVKILPGAEEAWETDKTTPVVADGVFTFVWRPELGGWKIHRYGEYALPEHLPRTSPGSAPSLV